MSGIGAFGFVVGPMRPTILPLLPLLLRHCDEKGSLKIGTLYFRQQ
jgi:hypothetical protein